MGVATVGLASVISQSTIDINLETRFLPWLIRHLFHRSLVLSASGTPFLPPGPLAAHIASHVVPSIYGVHQSA